MKPNLYICHTAYQVLVGLLRAGRTEGKPHTLVLSAAVADVQALAARLDKTGVVRTVLVDETRWPGTVTGPLADLRARRAFEKLCGWKLERSRYENIYIHNDWSVLGRYLQDCHAGYILCEDTFGSTLGPDQHLVTDGFCPQTTYRKRLLVLGGQPLVQAGGKRRRRPVYLVRSRQNGDRQQGRTAAIPDR